MLTKVDKCYEIVMLPNFSQCQHRLTKTMLRNVSKCYQELANVNKC